MSELLLNVEKREAVSKKVNKSLRRDSKVPCIYYMHGEEAIPAAVDEKELRTVISSDSSIIDLKFDDKKTSKCVIRDIQWDPVTSVPLHVDFMGIKLTEKVTVDIPIHFVGTPVGVKNEGGIQQEIVRELSIESLPLDIPEHFEVDVSALAIGDSIHVSDISIDKVEILNDPEQTLVTVSAPKIVEEEVEAEEDELTEPELVGEEKDEAEEETEKAEE